MHGASGEAALAAAMRAGVDPGLFRAPAFSAVLGMNTAALTVVFGGEFLIAQYLQLVLGLSPLEAGLWTLPPAAGFIAGSDAFAQGLQVAAVVSAPLMIALAAVALRLPSDAGGNSQSDP